MNGIDTGSAALVANRSSALNPVGSQGSTSATQTGVSALATGTPALPDAVTTGTGPQASAQTVLSAVALTLDAIIRSGGEATPAVVGNAPVWSDPGAATQAGAGALAGSLPGSLPGSVAGSVAGSGTGSGTLPGTADAAAQAAVIEAELLAGDAAALTQTETQLGASANLTGSGTADAAQAATTAGAQSGTAASSTAGSQTTAAGQATATGLAAAATPVAALAAALAQTVTDSGLFYESHLAQWLQGQRTPASLAAEPQNRLVDGTAQLPRDWSLAADDADDVFWTETSAAGSREPQLDSANASSARNAAAQTGPAALATNALLVRANGALADAALLPASTPASHDAQAAGAAIHPAVIPLVRQQLDLLATGEFRWTGEAWAGVRLDWSIQQDRVDARDARHGAADPEDAQWRTRLTLALPSLGTVDAELTLTGQSLAVRVQANPDGASRLVEGGNALKGRLEALGLALTGFSIREVGSGATGSAEAAKAANAYARAAAQEAQEAQAEQAAAQARAAEQQASTAVAGAGYLDWDL